MAPRERSPPQLPPWEEQRLQQLQETQVWLNDSVEEDWNLYGEPDTLEEEPAVQQHPCQGDHNVGMVPNVSRYRAQVAELEQKHRVLWQGFCQGLTTQLSQLKNDLKRQHAVVSKQLCDDSERHFQLHVQREKQQGDKRVLQLRVELQATRNPCCQNDKPEHAPQESLAQGQGYFLREFHQHVLQEHLYEWKNLRRRLQIAFEIRKYEHYGYWHRLQEMVEMLWEHKQAELAVLWQIMTQAHMELQQNWPQGSLEVKELVAEERRLMAKQIMQEQTALCQAIWTCYVERWNAFQHVRHDDQMWSQEVMRGFWYSVQEERNLLDAHIDPASLQPPQDLVSLIEAAEEKMMELWETGKLQAPDPYRKIYKEMSEETQRILKDSKYLNCRMEDENRNMFHRMWLGRFHPQ